MSVYIDAIGDLNIGGFARTPDGSIVKLIEDDGVSFIGEIVDSPTTAFIGRKNIFVREELQYVIQSELREFDKPRNVGETTIYGRMAIGAEQGKPLIPNNEFKTLLEQVQAGNIAAYDEAKEKYSFEKTQLALLQQFARR